MVDICIDTYRRGRGRARRVRPAGEENAGNGAEERRWVENSVVASKGTSMRPSTSAVVSPGVESPPMEQSEDAADDDNQHK